MACSLAMLIIPKEKKRQERLPVDISLPFGFMDTLEEASLEK